MWSSVSFRPDLYSACERFFGMHWIGGCVDHRTRLLPKPGTELRLLGDPSHNLVTPPTEPFCSSGDDILIVWLQTLRRWQAAFSESFGDYLVIKFNQEGWVGTQLNTWTRLRNHSCSGKAKGIAYFCVCVDGCGYTDAGVCMRACSLNYSTCNAPPCCHQRPLWFCHIFRHYLVHGTIFWKKLLIIKCLFLFSL
jgi:hypothetical protein